MRSEAVYINLGQSRISPLLNIDWHFMLGLFYILLLFFSMLSYECQQSPLRCQSQLMSMSLDIPVTRRCQHLFSALLHDAQLSLCVTYLSICLELWPADLCLLTHTPLLFDRMHQSWGFWTWQTVCFPKLRIKLWGGKKRAERKWGSGPAESETSKTTLHCRLNVALQWVALTQLLKKTS